MSIKINVKPLGRFARLADAFMTPVMYALSGTLREAPQQTHRWNNMGLKPNQIRYLKPGQMVHASGSLGALRRIKPLFHAPIFGGWRDYVVVQAESYAREWYVGWMAGDAIGISKIPIRGKVRVLRGPKPCTFFGLRPDGSQVRIVQVGCGRIGRGGPYAKVPLR